MNWDVLIIAAPLLAGAVALWMWRKALRVAAVLAGLATLGLISAVPGIRAQLQQLTGAGPGMVILSAGAAIFAIAFVFDVIRGYHKKALMGRSGSGHHLRPIVAAVGLAIVGILFAANLPAFQQAAGSGVSQMFSTATHPGA